MVKPVLKVEVQEAKESRESFRMDHLYRGIEEWIKGGIQVMRLLWQQNSQG